MIHDLLSLKEYFLQFKSSVFGIEDYCFGNSDDILDRKSKIIRYPCLWVELLEEFDDDSGEGFFSVRLILQNLANKDRDLDYNVLNNMRLIMRKVLDKMHEDSPSKLVFHKPKPKFLFKESFQGDDELLVACDLTFGIINICN